MKRKINYLRQKGIFSPNEAKQQPITVIGAGGIGSPCVLTLAKTGFRNITVVDDDRVELHNLPNQFYRLKDVGKPKVEALQKIVLDLTGTKIGIRKERFVETTPCGGIIISGVDTMADRHAIWKAILAEGDVSLYIDARMGGQVFCIHTVDPHDPKLRKWYEGTLCSDEKAHQEPCTARAIIYTTMVSAGLIAAQVAKFTLGEQPRRLLTVCLKTMTFMVE
jgi:molybdopterin/thiamine biosynthesis adenylyltransferase